MASIGEGRSCQVDEDCSVEQYCYDVSQQCVDYTRCNRYNRLEGKGRSRHPSHCGNCLPTFKAEILSTGDAAILCKKMELLQPTADPAKLSNAVIIWIIMGAILTAVSVAVGLVYRKRICAMCQKKQKSKQWISDCVVGPTAPPLENGPFLETGERITNEPFNNNHHAKDKNRLVNATPCKEPNWIRTNPDYEHNLDNSSLGAVGHLHTDMLLPGNNNNSEMWEPVQLSIQGYTSEERDNTINTDLYQRNYPGSSEDAGNSSANSSDNAGGSSPEMNDGQQNRQGSPNVLIAQKVSVNVNVFNN